MLSQTFIWVLRPDTEFLCCIPLSREMSSVYIGPLDLSEAFQWIHLHLHVS